MINLHERYIVDTDGNRTAVVLDLATFDEVLRALEDLEDLRDGAAMLTRIAAGEEEVMTLEQATAELEAEWAARKPAEQDT